MVVFGMVVTIYLFFSENSEDFRNGKINLCQTVEIVILFAVLSATIFYYFYKINQIEILSRILGFVAGLLTICFYVVLIRCHESPTCFKSGDGFYAKLDNNSYYSVEILGVSRLNKTVYFEVEFEMMNYTNGKVYDRQNDIGIIAAPVEQNKNVANDFYSFF